MVHTDALANNYNAVANSYVNLQSSRMDVYARNILDMVASGVDVVTVDHDNIGAINGDTIVIRSNNMNSCPKVVELTNLVTKRLRGKGCGTTKLSTVAVCTICSEGYSINHLSLSNVSARDMHSIWAFIETSAVSSSPELRNWVKHCVGGRSQDGYVAYMDLNSDTSMLDTPGSRTRHTRAHNKLAKIPGPMTAVTTRHRAFTSIIDVVINDVTTLSRARIIKGMDPLMNVGPTWEEVTLEAKS